MLCISSAALSFAPATLPVHAPTTARAATFMSAADKLCAASPCAGRARGYSAPRGILSELCSSPGAQHAPPSVPAGRVLPTRPASRCGTPLALPTWARRRRLLGSGMLSSSTVRRRPAAPPPAALPPAHSQQQLQLTLAASCRRSARRPRVHGCLCGLAGGCVRCPLPGPHLVLGGRLVRGPEQAGAAPAVGRGALTRCLTALAAHSRFSPAERVA